MNPARFASLHALALVALVLACRDPEGPAKPTAMQASAGDQQSGPAGTTLPNPIAVKVTDAHRRGVPGQQVTFVVVSGGGRLASATATTNSRGIAINRWTLGSTATQPQVVAAQLLDPATGEVIATATFSATALPGPAARLVKVSGDLQSWPSGALPSPLVVAAVDAFGNPVAGVTVSFAVTAGGGGVNPATAVTNAVGRASTTFSLGTAGTAQSVSATATGLPTVIFTANVFRPGEGTSIPLTGRPFAVGVSSANVVYVGRQDDDRLTRFNGAPLPIAGEVVVGDDPTDIAFNPSGTRAYVANQFSSNVGVVNVATNVQESTIPVTGNPFKVLVSPDGTRLYVNTNADKVFAIDIATGATLGQLGFAATPNGLAIAADGSKLYVSTRAAGTVVEVDTRTMTALRTFTPGGMVQEVVLAPGGGELYTVNEDGSFFVYNLTTGTLVTSFALGGNPFGMALTPDGTKLYVTLTRSGEIKVIDRATRTVTRTVLVGGTPRRIAFTADGTAVVGNEAGYVTFVR